MKFADIYPKRIDENHKREVTPSELSYKTQWNSTRDACLVIFHARLASQSLLILRYIQSCYYDLLQQAPLVGVLQVWHSTHSCPGGLSSLCVSIARVVAALPSRLPMIFFHSIVRMTRSSPA